MTEGQGMTEMVGALLKKHDEKLRFLVVGMFNTAVGYALFALMLHVFGVQRYNVALLVQWCISVSISYTMFKLFVFRTRGTNWLQEWMRSYIVYAGALTVNLLVLNAFVKLAHMHPLVGQVASLFIVTIASYLGHKYFTFGNRHVIEALDAGEVFAHDPDTDSRVEPSSRSGEDPPQEQHGSG